MLLPHHTDPCRETDIMISFDNSGSITELDPENWNYMIDYSTNLVSNVTLGSNEYQVGALLFGNSGRIKIALNKTYSQAVLTNHLEDLIFQAQRTNLEGGLYATRVDGFSQTNGARAGVYKVAIFLYDGESPNEDFGGLSSALVEAPKLKEEGVEVFVYTLKHYIELEETPLELLESIASEPNSTHLFIMNNWEDLADMASSTLNTIKDSCHALVENGGLSLPGSKLAVVGSSLYIKS